MNLNVMSLKAYLCVSAVSEGNCLFIMLSMATGGLRGVADGNMEWKDRWKKFFCVNCW